MIVLFCFLGSIDNSSFIIPCLSPSHLVLAVITVATMKTQTCYVLALLLLLLLVAAISFSLIGVTWTRVDTLESRPSSGSSTPVNLSSSSVVGILNSTHGGTGFGNFTDGELLIGTSVGNTLVKNTLTAGPGVIITNGPGEVIIGATGLNTTIEGGNNIDVVVTNDSITIDVTGTIDVDNGGTGFSSTYMPGELLIGNNLGTLSRNTLTAGTNIAITNGDGTITVALTGIVGVSNGGTGQNTYTNGQILVGTSSGNTLVKTTITAGAGISIVNGPGTITISATGGGGGGSNLTIVGGTNIDVTTVGNTSTISITGIIDSTNGGTGFDTYTDGNLLIGSSAGNTLAKSTLTAGAGIIITNGPGTITITAVGGGGGGDGNLTIVGGTNIGVVSVDNVTTISLTGTVLPANGGTGQTTYTAGQILIGNSGGGLTKNTLTAGTNIAITNGNGAITIAVTGTVATANGGTGQTTYTSGQILIGNSGGGLTKSTLTAGTGISITNGNGAITIALTAPVPTNLGGTGQTTYTNGQLLIGNTAGGTLVKSTLTAGQNILVTNGAGSITIALNGVVPVANGGTGQTTYTNGQILIGSNTGNTLVKSTLTAGAGISITNGPGSISIAVSGGGFQPGIGTWTFYEQMAAGVAAGSCAAGAYQTRKLNYVQFYSGSEVTLDTTTNVMTFAPGTYYITASAPALMNRHRARLERVGGGVFMYCTSEWAYYDVVDSSATFGRGYTAPQTSSVCSGYLTIPSTETIYLRHFTAYNGITTPPISFGSVCLGRPTNSGPEIYSMVTVMKLA